MKQIRHAMLDQKIDAAEVEVENETCAELLNPASVIPQSEFSTLYEIGA